MKLSIWQQFSSNHSACFIVIGHFEKIEDAKKSAEHLRDWMQRMIWGEDRQVAEEELKARYDIEWYENGIDWNGWFDSVDEVVQQFENEVFLMSPEGTGDSSHQPFINLIEKMGAQSIVENISVVDSYSDGIVVDLRCKAPNVTIASDVFSLIKITLDEYKWYPVLWANYSPNYQLRTEIHVKDYQQQAEVYIRDRTALWAHVKEYTQNYRREYWKFMSQDKKTISSLLTISREARLYGGNIQLDDKTIQLENLEFAYLGIGFIALCRWLKDLGCEISYTFRKLSES